MKNINKFLIDTVCLGFYETESSSFSGIDFITLSKELKQAVRLLQNFKKINPAVTIYVWVENQLLVLLLTKIFSTKSSEARVYVSTVCPSLNTKTPSLLLILGVPYFKLNNSLIKKIFNSKNYLVLKINSAPENNCFFTYKVLNSLSDIKKFVFLSILIKKIFKNA
jgi:hypothetical protein